MAIFIDGNNFRHGLLALNKDEHIDWKVFLDQIKRDHNLTFVSYYIGKITYPLFEKEKVQEQGKLLKQLQAAGITPWLGYFNDDKHEKGVDVQIALDLTEGAFEKKFDVALLITGDGDLNNAVKLAQKYKVRVILGFLAGVRAGSYRISWILKSITDKQIALNQQAKEARQAWLNKNKNNQQPPAQIKTDNILPPLLLFADGGSRGNPGPGGCGVVITDKGGKVIEKISKYIGHTTNNRAEYQALLLGLETLEKAIGKNKIEKISCYLDSKLVVEQVKGKWKVKNRELKPLTEKVKSFLKKYPNTGFYHIPRAKNKLADQLVNEAIDKHTAIK